MKGILEQIQDDLRDLNLQMRSLHNNLARISQEIKGKNSPKSQVRIIHKEGIAYLLSISEEAVVKKWRKLQKMGYPIFKGQDGKISAIEDKLIAYISIIDQ